MYATLPIGTMVFVTDRFNAQIIISEPFNLHGQMMYHVVDVYGFKSSDVLHDNIHTIKKMGDGTTPYKTL